MELPAHLGKYKLIEFLGGGMSQVYRAMDTVINRTVAIKILTEVGCADEEVRARFLHEARTAAQINHENILTIYEYGEIECKPFLVMEFLEGEDLRKALANGHVGNVEDRLRIARQIARAVEYIHSKRITHRDIKPDNVHLNMAGTAKLMDFGIAKTEGPAMTQAGFIIGTPYYMAPEQVLGKPVTHLVDVYAFGMLLFELFTGGKPIQGETVQQVFYKILNEPVNLHPLVTAKAPEELRALIARCTAKNPGERIQSFTEICLQLERLANTNPAPKANNPGATDDSVRSSSTASVKEQLRDSARRSLASLRPFLNKTWPKPAIGGGAVAIAVLSILAVRGVLRATHHTSPIALELPKKLATETGEMLLIPGGTFRFGPNLEKVDLPSFYIDRTEVSNDAYEKFAKATKHSLPDGFDVERPYLPVVKVTLGDARAFAVWAHKRIPSAREWEKAARGADGRSYPWGNQADPSLANVLAKPKAPSAGLAPAIAFPGGSSPFGVLQMCGNAWEFVEGFTEPNPKAKEGFERLLKRQIEEPWVSIRGGAFDKTLAAVSESAQVPETFSSDKIGFRCVADPLKQ